MRHPSPANRSLPESAPSQKGIHTIELPPVSFLPPNFIRIFRIAENLRAAARKLEDVPELLLKLASIDPLNPRGLFADLGRVGAYRIQPGRNLLERIALDDGLPGESETAALGTTIGGPPMEKFEVTPRTLKRRHAADGNFHVIVGGPIPLRLMRPLVLARIPFEPCPLLAFFAAIHPLLPGEIIACRFEPPPALCACSGLAHWSSLTSFR
jgi:hypothetical protein